MTLPTRPAWLAAQHNHEFTFTPKTHTINDYVVEIDAANLLVRVRPAEKRPDADGPLRLTFGVDVNGRRVDHG